VCVCTEAKCDNLIVKLSKEKGVATSYLTSKKGARFLHREYHFSKDHNESTFDVSVEVNRAKAYQKILGFGGAFTDASGLNIAKLPKGLQERLIRDYYGDDGIGYRIGRIPIGGSDFSTRAYSYDDGATDETLSKFALQPEDFNYKVRLPRSVFNLY
jgi:glucosylceramidase